MARGVYRRRYPTILPVAYLAHIPDYRCDSVGQSVVRHEKVANAQLLILLIRGHSLFVRVKPLYHFMKCRKRRINLETNFERRVMMC